MQVTVSYQLSADTNLVPRLFHLTVPAPEEQRIVFVSKTRDQPEPGSFFGGGGREMKEPGNEVERTQPARYNNNGGHCELQQCCCIWASRKRQENTCTSIHLTYHVFFCLYFCISPTLPSFHCCLSSTYLWTNVKMNYSDYEVKFRLKSNPSVPLQIGTNRSNISFHGVYGSMEVHSWTTDCGLRWWLEKLYQYLLRRA